MVSSNKRAVIYARYSSDNQRDESIDAQVRASREYADKHNLTITKEYVDKAKSATTDKRPEFQNMISDSSKDLFDIVIVHKLDRFSRDKYDSANYKRKLKANGIQLISVTENLDGSPESIILESVIEGMGQYYSANLAREVMKGLKETAYQCKHTGGTPPLGYDIALDKTYIINQNEAETVRQIFDMYINGHSYSQIIRQMTAKGYRTKINQQFRRNSLYSILSNEKYSGVYIYNKSSKKDPFGKRNSHSYKDESEIIKIEDGMPAIIPKETFQKTQEMMNKRKISPAANKAKELYLLSGLIFCGECNKPMQGNRRKSNNKPLYCSYRCSRRDEETQCENQEIRKEYIEEYVLSELEKNILNDKAIPILVEKINLYLTKKSSSSGAEIVNATKELTDVNTQIDNIVNAISNGFSQGNFITKMKELEERKAQLELRISETELSNTKKIDEEQIRKIISIFKQFVMERNLPECKKFIHNYVQKVIIFKDRVEVIFNTAFVMSDTNSIHMTSKVKKMTLYNKYDKSFYIKAV